MITDETRQAIPGMHEKGMKIRQISRTPGISRNTVRTVLKGDTLEEKGPSTSFEDEMPLIRETFTRCRGNVVRVAEVLAEKGTAVGCSTPTRIARDQGLRGPRKPRSGAYTFGPGEEMQHDTSPHKVLLDGKSTTAQCAGLVLAYSRRLLIRYCPCFTRFVAKVLLAEAFAFTGGVCNRVVIDNTSVIVACVSGPDARISPKMEAFGRIYDIAFVPYRIGYADRRARSNGLFPT